MRRKTLLVLLLAVGMSSCGLFKRVSTNRNGAKEHIKTDSVYNTTVVDKTKTVVVEKIDTVVATKPISIDAVVQSQVDKDGNVLATLDTLMVKVRVRFNAIKKTVEFGIEKHSELLPFKIERTTITENDITTDSKGHVKTNIKSRINQKSKIKEPQWGVISAVIGGLVLVFFALGMWLRYKSKPAKAW